MIGVFGGDSSDRRPALDLLGPQASLRRHARVTPSPWGDEKGDAYILEAPYLGDTELTPDHLRCIPGVEALALGSPRREVAQGLQPATWRYNDAGNRP